MNKSIFKTLVLLLAFKASVLVGFSQAAGFTIYETSRNDAYYPALLLRQDNGLNLVAMSKGSGASTQYLIVDYRSNSSSKGSLVIPSTINGYPVIGLQNANTLAGCPATSITIPSSFQDQFLSFAGCLNLTTISIPLSISTCPNFSECTNLKNITLPISITSIPEYSFQNSGITVVTIPDSVTSIGYKAFYGCPLTTVTIPDSVTSLGLNLFEGCASLSTIKLPLGLKSISDGMFNCCYSLNNVTLPSSVTSIGSNAFAQCRSLTNISLSTVITSIGTNAFDRTGLKSILLPSTVQQIGDGASFGPLARIRTCNEVAPPTTNPAVRELTLISTNR